MPEIRGKKKKRTSGRAGASAGNRAAMIAITLVVCLLFAVLAIEDYRLNRRIDANLSRRAALEARIEEEQLRTDSILEMRAYMETDEFIRDKAKERLGLVEPGELIFKAAG